MRFANSYINAKIKVSLLKKAVMIHILITLPIDLVPAAMKMKTTMQATPKASASWPCSNPRSDKEESGPVSSTTCKNEYEHFLKQNLVSTHVILSCLPCWKMCLAPRLWWRGCRWPDTTTWLQPGWSSWEPRRKHIGRNLPLLNPEKELQDMKH